MSVLTYLEWATVIRSTTWRDNSSLFISQDVNLWWLLSYLWDFQLQLSRPISILCLFLIKMTVLQSNISIGERTIWPDVWLPLLIRKGHIMTCYGMSWQTTWFLAQMSSIVIKCHEISMSPFINKCHHVKSKDISTIQMSSNVLTWWHLMTWRDVVNLIQRGI